MTIQRYRKIYIEHHGTIPKDAEGRSYEIHHIDGNHSNNDISNLICVSIQEHYNIHYAQGDFGACYFMALRMKKTVEELREIASLAGKKSASRRINAGTHHWLSQQHSELSKQRELARVEDGTHPFTKEHNTQIARQRVINKSHNFQGENAPSQQQWKCEICGKKVKVKEIIPDFMV